MFRPSVMRRKPARSTVERAAAEKENVDQVLAGPGLDVEPVVVAAGHGLRHTDGKQQRPAPFLGDFLEGHAHSADEVGHGVAVQPRLADRQRRRAAAEVQINSVEVVVLGQFAEDGHLVVVYAGNGVVPVILIKERAATNEPVGMLCFHRLLETNCGCSAGPIRCRSR